MNTNNNIYPNFSNDPQYDHIIYYVEFNRGNSINTFTVFQRNLIPKELQEDYPISMRELHPYQLFSSHCHENGYPSHNWIKWMIDQLNKTM